MRKLVLVLALALIASSPLPPHAQMVAVGQSGPPSAGEVPTMLPPGRAAKTGTGRVRGRVTAADTGAVVRRAQVRITSPDMGGKTVFTDALGRFEFRELPAGRFKVSVSKSGFVTIEYGQNRPFESGKPIELADGQTMEKADVALPRGSAVSGRILDEFGDPVADASVAAMRLQYSGGKRRLEPSGRASMTNDHGYFRVFGLPPGDYFLSASVNAMDAMMMDLPGLSSGAGPSGAGGSSGYATTYYPGTQKPAEAQRLTLAVGEEMQVDLQLQTVRLAQIAGTASSSDGKPMSGAMVMLTPRMKDGAGLMFARTSQTDKDGHFTLTGIPPGDYSIEVQSLAALMSAATQMMSLMGGGETKEGAPAAKPAAREFALATVTVAGEDIAGLAITATRGATARGRIVFEGGKPTEPLASLRLMAPPADFDNAGSAGVSAFSMASVKENGTFEIDGLAGQRLFEFMTTPEGWFLKRVTHEGNDITDSGYDFKPGEEVDGLEIRMTRRTQRLGGKVTNDTGEAVQHYTVVVFTEDEEKWALPSPRRIASSRPNHEGRFEFRELPAGRYLAVAVEYVAEGEWRDPEWLARAARNATKVTLEEGASVTLDLKLLKT